MKNNAHFIISCLVLRKSYEFYSDTIENRVQASEDITKNKIKQIKSNRIRLDSDKVSFNYYYEFITLAVIAVEAWHTLKKCNQIKANKTKPQQYSMHECAICAWFVSNIDKL